MGSTDPSSTTMNSKAPCAFLTSEASASEMESSASRTGTTMDNLIKFLFSLKVEPGLRHVVSPSTRHHPGAYCTYW